MTREQIIAMALEAGIAPDKSRIGDDFMDVHWGELEKFAALVAQHERDECAKVCLDCGGCRDAINARGKK